VKTADEWNNKGNALYELKRYEDAIKAYDKAIELNPKYTDPWNNKGLVLHKLKRYEDAIKAYDKAIELDPKYADPWYNKGNVLAKLKRYEDAIEAYDKAIELDPKDAYPWYGKGNALYELKRYEDAIEAYDKAIEIDPKHAYPWFSKGNVLARLKRYEDAIEAYDKAIEIDPKYAYPWNNKGLVLHELKRYEDAIEAYDKAIEIYPKDASLHCNLGEYYLELSDLKNASKKVGNALRIKEKFANALFLKGRIEVEEQRYRRAIVSFEKAITIEHGNPLILIWYAYSKYLDAEFSPKLHGKKYKEKIHSIIRILERVETLPKISTGQEIRAYILYFIGCCYYKINDTFSAQKKLAECAEIKSGIKLSAAGLLDNIWTYQSGIFWWRWWLSSPLHRWIRRIVFTTLLIAIFGLSLLHLSTLIIAFLILILFSPVLKSIKAKEIELELRSPLPAAFEISPAMLESQIPPLQTK
jgi:tetratricopeptide (TPR) repeat protein